MDDEEALVVIGLVQVLLRVNLKNVVAHLEANRLYFLGHLLARLLDVAESLVRLAVKLWQGSSPLLPDFFEDAWRNRQLRRACVNDGWERGILSWFLHSFSSVTHALTLESPSAQPVWIVLESLQASLASNNLGRVVAAKESVRGFIHFLGGN